MILAEAELESALLAELGRHNVLSLAVVSDARPHSVSLMYAHDDFDIYWLSDPKTRHSRCLASNPSVAVTIAAQHKDFREIRGVQMAGNAHRLTDTDAQAMGFNLLLARYPFLKKFSIGKLARHMGAAAVYRFRPTNMTFIDNSRGFGFKQTLVLQETINEKKHNR